MNKIREFRAAKGMSQTDLSLKLGWANARLSNYELDYRLPTIHTIRVIAKALDCTVDELYPPAK